MERLKSEFSTDMANPMSGMVYSIALGLKCRGNRGIGDGDEHGGEELL